MSNSGEEMFDTDLRTVNKCFAFDILHKFKATIDPVVGPAKTRIGRIYISPDLWREYLEIDIPTVMVGVRPINDITLVIITSYSGNDNRSCSLAFKFAEKGVVMRGRGHHVYPHAKQRSWCLDGTGISQIASSLKRGMIIPAYFLAVNMIEHPSKYDVYRFSPGQMVCKNCQGINCEANNRIIDVCIDCRDHICRHCAPQPRIGEIVCPTCSIEIEVFDRERKRYVKRHVSSKYVNAMHKKIHRQITEWENWLRRRRIRNRLTMTGGFMVGRDYPDLTVACECGEYHYWRDVIDYHCSLCRTIFCPRTIKHVCDNLEKETNNDNNKESLREIESEGSGTTWHFVTGYDDS